MIRKTTMAVVAALVLGSAGGALASAGDNEPNTGLWTVSYMGEHGGATGVSAKRRDPVMLLEDRGQTTGPYNPPHANTFEYNWYDKQSGHNW